MGKWILHCDCDAFYASVEELHHPELRGKPMAVCGDPDKRHGIVLAKTQPAKLAGVKTGEVLWQARQKCPDIVFLPANADRYLEFSEKVRNIYLQYTGEVEAFGLDENWVALSENFNRSLRSAKEIQSRIRDEIGIGVSIGMSYNKIFAKLGSDLYKPQGFAVITPNNYQELVWPLPVGDLLMVGPATRRKLHQKYIYTIGELASTSVGNLRRWLGKHGETLHRYANGNDNSPVAKFDELQTVKSIGNSKTMPRDLENNEEVKMGFYSLAESVGQRMREKGFKGKEIAISVRDKDLYTFIRQHQLKEYTNLTREIADGAMTLFLEHYRWHAPIRSIGVSVSRLEHEEKVLTQFDLFNKGERREHLETLDKTMDQLKERYGKNIVRCAVQMTDVFISQGEACDSGLHQLVNYPR